MKNCTYRLGLDELLNAPMGLLTLQGSDGEGDGDKGDPDANADANKGDKDDKSKEPGDGDDGKKDGDKSAAQTPDQKRIAALEEEKQRFYDQREEARSEIKTLKAEIAKLKKDGTPDDAVKSENETLTTENAKLTQANQKLMLENAFLKETGYDWVDPSAALRLADLDAVEFDEKTGKAVGLGSALAKLAKDSPYLLKPKTDEDKDKDDKDGKPGQRRTGQPPRGGTQKQSDQAAREAKLRAKYPALRR